MDKLILVTGATGYIASRLIPRLLEHGYQVRCLVREPRRLKGRSWFRYVELVQGEVTSPSTLAPALDGVHTAYYLIHNMTYGRGYTELELEGARAFASAAEKAEVEHIIYLGGLADPAQHIAPHMRSRIETGRMLREGKVPVTEFRAGVITGSGSISFEMIRFMTELFPIVPGPTWMKNKAQPIAIQNVIDYLFAALENPNGRGGVYEIGGPDITTYGDLMLRYARIRGLQRKMILLPGIPLWFMAFGVGLMTPVPRPIAYALIGGLANDSVVQHTEALEVFPKVNLIDFTSATKDALEKTHPSHIERVWDDGVRRVKSLKHEGCFIDHREMLTHASPEKVFQTLTRVINNPNLCVEVNQPTRRIIVRDKDQRPGDKWIEWRVGRTGSPTYLTQIVFFSPRGLPGFLYWYLLYPLHVINSRTQLRKIVQRSENQ
ncbi:MAG TPA: NmrA family NAD(P)-binding protein [Anaerolineales bacterium]